MSEVSTVTAAAPMAETPDRYGAYPRLTNDQIAALEASGTRRSSAAGETLVHEGKRTDDFFVILSGKVAIITTDETGNRRGSSKSMVRAGSSGNWVPLKGKPRSTPLHRCGAQHVLADRRHRAR
jgi:CRP-like cAMP-binding protein